jgi:hypothetical protein
MILPCEYLAKATLKIKCGNTSGSGFHFMKPEIIVTNFHVIKPCIEQKERIFAITEHNNRTELQLLAYSSEFDYAILKMTRKLKEERVALEPKEIIPYRGMKVCFAGFPHRENVLLVQVAYVSGFLGDYGFYLDGSLNPGNSGGPIIDVSDKKVIGIVTFKRFVCKKELEDVEKQIKFIHQHFQKLGGKAGVIISGIDFGEFAQFMSKALEILKYTLVMNANTGIGAGYRIDFVMKKLKEIET